MENHLRSAQGLGSADDFDRFVVLYQSLFVEPINQQKRFCLPTVESKPRSTTLASTHPVKHSSSAPRAAQLPRWTLRCLADEFLIKIFPRRTGPSTETLTVFPYWHHESRNDTSVFTATTFQNLWLLSMGIKRAAQKLREANVAAVALLIADADKALIDLDMVRTASCVEEQNRIIEETLQAYNAIFDRLPRFKIGAEQLILLDERMSALRQQLIEAGRIKNRRRQA